MVTVPSEMVITPSHFMPLPPEPVAVRLSVPPLMVMLPSLLKPQAALVSRSSLSHSPLPVVFTVMAPPLISISPSHFMPLAAVAVQVMLTVPSLI